MKRLSIQLFALVLGMMAVTAQLSAQTYPNRPLRLIVPGGAGGGLDLFARVVAQKMSEGMGQQIVVENRTGAGGNIGTSAGAKSPADGYTLTAVFNGTMGINPFLYRQPGYDAIKDFAPISLGTVQPEVLAAHPALPASSLKELVALAKSKPGKLSFGSSGPPGQLVVELFKHLNKVDVLLVPYKSAPEALTDLITGYVDCAVMGNAAAVPHHTAGRIKVIAILGPERMPLLRNVPSSVESGMPGLQMVSWYGVSAPAGTPKDIVAKLNSEMTRALAAADVKDRLTNAGLTPRGSTPEELATLIRNDYERLGKVFKDAKIPPVE